MKEVAEKPAKKPAKQNLPIIELSAKEEVFCMEYICDHALNVTRAYMKAYKGSTYESARANGCRLIAKDNIRQRIDTLKTERNKRLELSADRVLLELAKLSFYDPRAFFDDDGRLKPISELDPDHAAVIAGIETIHKVTGEDDDGLTITTKIKLPNKNESLEKLGKNLLLWKDIGSKENPLMVLTDEQLDARLAELSK